VNIVQIQVIVASIQSGTCNCSTLLLLLSPYPQLLFQAFTAEVDAWVVGRCERISCAVTINRQRQWRSSGTPAQLVTGTSRRNTHAGWTYTVLRWGHVASTKIPPKCWCNAAIQTAVACSQQQTHWNGSFTYADYWLVTSAYEFPELHLTPIILMIRIFGL
jgi:hypothetical protein